MYILFGRVLYINEAIVEDATVDIEEVGNGGISDANG